ncbi:MAG: alpha-glucan phosphorylase [Nitrospira sp.]|nr:MAG: alpha-glucan phosphorylase [Nitrospira sp.]
MTTDPVCGMMIPVGEGLSVVYQGREIRFCSDLCKRTFLATPERYAAIPAGAAQGVVDVARRIAYFSIEVAMDPGMPTYSGGLGVLAGDMLRSCADLKIPIVAVSLLYARGYFEQHLDDASVSLWLSGCRLARISCRAMSRWSAGCCPPCC